MQKEQFWEIIETINSKVPGGVQSEMLRCAEDELSKLTIQELITYDEIFNVYLNAARRQYLWAASAALGAHYTDDGFAYFRSWLISRGKKVYMDALRDPETLSDGPIRKGEKLNFELFAYVPHKVYEKKSKEAKGQIGKYGEYDDLFAARSAYPLDQKEKKAIRAELPKRKDICRAAALCEKIREGVIGIVASQLGEVPQIKGVASARSGALSREGKQVFIHGRWLLSDFLHKKSRSHP